jgi:hypothetical protein
MLVKMNGLGLPVLPVQAPDIVEYVALLVMV